MPWVGKWLGGRIWEARDGVRTYWIRRKVEGRPYNLSTRCTSERAALKQLERFEADPSGYSPGGAAGDALVLDEELSRAFLRWSRDEKGNSAEWVGKQKRYLAWWAKQLGRRDLRRVSLRDHIQPALDKAENARQRIEVIKALYGWLRKHRHTVTPAQDPTYGALPVPQGRPEQWKTPKPIPPDAHAKVLLAIPQPFRDMLAVLDDTGWHVSELTRFLRPRRGEAAPRARHVLKDPVLQGGAGSLRQGGGAALHAGPVPAHARDEGDRGRRRPRCGGRVPGAQVARDHAPVLRDARGDPEAPARFLEVADADPPDALRGAAAVPGDEAVEVRTGEPDLSPQLHVADPVLLLVHVGAGDPKDLRDLLHGEELGHGGDSGHGLVALP
jgi:hypothetical protein